MAAYIISAILFVGWLIAFLIFKISNFAIHLIFVLAVLILIYKAGKNMTD